MLDHCRACDVLWHVCYETRVCVGVRVTSLVPCMLDYWHSLVVALCVCFEACVSPDARVLWVLRA
jgi:hypothetical protein